MIKHFRYNIFVSSGKERDKTKFIPAFPRVWSNEVLQYILIWFHYVIKKHTYLFCFTTYINILQELLILKTPYFNPLFFYIHRLFLSTFYWLCYYSCPNFFSSIPFLPVHPLPPSSPPPLVHVHGSCIYVLWLLHFLYYS